MLRTTILALLLLVTMTGCRGVRTITIEIPTESSGVNRRPTIEMTLPEAGLLPTPPTDSLWTRRDLPPGSIVSPPETVLVYVQPRPEPPDGAFRLLEATVDSAQVTIYGTSRDCTFRAPADGEVLHLTVTATSCEGHITGEPVQRTLTLPVKEICPDTRRGLRGWLEDMLMAVIVVIGLVAVISVARLFLR